MNLTSETPTQAEITVRNRLATNLTPKLLETVRDWKGASRDAKLEVETVVREAFGEAKQGRFFVLQKDHAGPEICFDLDSDRYFRGIEIARVAGVPILADADFSRRAQKILNPPQDLATAIHTSLFPGEEIGRLFIDSYHLDADLAKKWAEVAESYDRDLAHKLKRVISSEPYTGYGNALTESKEVLKTLNYLIAKKDDLSQEFAQLREWFVGHVCKSVLPHTAELLPKSLDDLGPTHFRSVLESATELAKLSSYQPCPPIAANKLVELMTPIIDSRLQEGFEHSFSKDKFKCIAFELGLFRSTAEKIGMPNEFSAQLNQILLVPERKAAIEKSSREFCQKITAAASTQDLLGLCYSYEADFGKNSPFTQKIFDDLFRGVTEKANGSYQKPEDLLKFATELKRYANKFGYTIENGWEKKFSNYLHDALTYWSKHSPDSEFIKEDRRGYRNAAKLIKRGANPFSDIDFDKCRESLEEKFFKAFSSFFSGIDALSSRIVARL